MHTILYKKQNIKELLATHSLALKKRWGQNFLINYFFVEKIAQLIFSLAHTNGKQKPLRIWEIGPGLGSVSAALLLPDVQLTVFEIDYGIVHFLEKEFAQERAMGKITIVSGDAEKTLEQYVSSGATLPHVVCGNLPYSSAVRILIKVSSLEQLHVPAVYMIQKEAVDRLVSTVGESQYGISSVLMQSVFSLSHRFSVSADSFYPVPSVESTVFSCIPDTHIGNSVYSLLCAIVRAAFSQRRKKLYNTLVPMLFSVNGLFGDMKTAEEKKASICHLLETCSISVHMRAEEVAVKQYVQLAKYIDQVMR